MSSYRIDVQEGLALSASWRHPEVLRPNILERGVHVKASRSGVKVKA